MTAWEAVRRYVAPSAVLGLGGQNINRCPMALVHEIVRQSPRKLTVVGCNLSLPLDMLAAAGLVASTEQGSGNLERYGSLFTWRRLAESGEITVKDYSHLGMATRFLAGALGVPHMPTRSLLGSDMLDRLVADGDARVEADPWSGEPIVLLPSITPDVSVIHASRADEAGNVVIDGVTSHEIDMIKASRAGVVSVEEILPDEALSSQPETVTLSSAFVDAVVLQPYGAFPTSVYRRYDYCEEEIRDYQNRSREGGRVMEDYLGKFIFGHRTFDEYLEKRDPHGDRRDLLEQSMRSLS